MQAEDNRGPKGLDVAADRQHDPRQGQPREAVEMDDLRLILAQGTANAGGRPGYPTKARLNGQDRDPVVFRERRAELADVAVGLWGLDAGRAVVDQADPHRLEELTASPGSPFPLHHQAVVKRRGDGIAKVALVAAG